MSVHAATVEWRRLGGEFDYQTYDRGHWLSFGDDVRVPGDGGARQHRSGSERLGCRP